MPITAKTTKTAPSSSASAATNGSSSRAVAFPAPNVTNRAVASNGLASSGSGRNARPGSGLSLSVLDLAAIRKILENETGGALCPSCQMPFDKGKKRKLIDTCGHERCYSCMFRNEICPICHPASQPDIDHDILSNHGSYLSRKMQGYDTGIGSTTTLLSPLSSPQPVCRSQVRQAGHLSPTYQSPSDLMSSDVYKLKDRPPRCPSASSKSESHYASISNASFGMGMKPSQRSGLNSSSEISSSACATPPQNRRRLFSPKNLRSPFGYRRSNAATDNSTLSGLASLLNPATYHRAAASGTSNLRSSTSSPSAATSPTASTVNKRQRNANDSHKFHRLSLGKASMVFGKIKSLWSAQASTVNAGLNQLAGTGCSEF